VSALAKDPRAHTIGPRTHIADSIVVASALLVDGETWREDVWIVLMLNMNPTDHHNYTVAKTLWDSTGVSHGGAVRRTLPLHDCVNIYEAVEWFRQEGGGL